MFSQKPFTFESTYEETLLLESTMKVTASGLQS